MRTLSLLVTCLLAACPAEDRPPPTLDREFRLGYAQHATIESEGLTLRFTAVTEDSRCPSDVQCVWAGQATITLEASRPPDPAATLSLTLPSPDTAAYAEYTVTLKDLEPYPTAAGSTPHDDYTAVLRVSKP